MADDSMSDEDKALFREQMRFVKPLNEKNKRVGRLPPKATDKSPPIHSASTVNKKAFSKKEYYLSDFINETVFSNTILSYCVSGVPTKRFRALRHGLIPWESRLDLHGLKAEAARETLSHFIQDAAYKNKRCLLIIHGKGGHQGAPPVIKNLVNRWLPQFGEVLAFHSAQAKDGGHGAVYVLLKRNKED